MKDWIPLLVAALAVLGAGGSVYSLITLGATKRKLLAEAASINATTTTVLTQSAMDLLAPLREEATDARAEVKKLRAEVRELTAMMRRWKSAIVEPTATLDRLRSMVNSDLSTKSEFD